MKITKIFIEKFRGFENVKFELGSHLTIISGQNGTQKTTLLGLLTQPFTITDKENPMHGEKPLSGENFRSEFSDKFKLSKSFDKIGNHKWTLFFDDKSEYTAGSIDRGGNKKGEIRIWKVNEKTGKADKTKGSGYIQIPVIYLSLKRLLPIGEDYDLDESKSLSLTDEEKNFYAKWHNEILILTRDEDKIINTISLESPNKQTLGANTSYYDWQTNSAGQDNIGKILLAILSFKRLKEKYPNNYTGGILAIDEADTTFYPGAQKRLLKALNKFATQFAIQIIFTTHSLTLLEETSLLKDDPHRKDQIKLTYLIKKDKKIDIKNNVTYDFIKNHLNRTISGQATTKQINVYTEDKECALFVKSLLGTSRTKHLNFIDINFSCSLLLELASKKVPSFNFPNSIIILDGDVRTNKSMYKKTKRLKNILILPTKQSPERIISEFLHYLPADNPLWQSIDETFEHETCFELNGEACGNDEILKDRDKAKKWFNSHLRLWGRNAFKVLNPWKKQNKKLVDKFINEFDNLFNKF
jgi:predicted ATPase